MKVFIDANILVSVINQEYPLFSITSRILSLADYHPFELYVSPLSLAIAFYFAGKKHGDSVALKKVNMLAEHVKITTMDASCVTKIGKDRRIDDFEDGLQYYAALKAGCECIVTEDLNDFHFSNILVLNAENFWDSQYELIRSAKIKNR